MSPGRRAETWRRRPFEIHPIRQAPLRGESLAIVDYMLVDIPAVDPASTHRRQVDGRSPRARTDLQDVALRAHLKQIGEPKPRRCGHPATLANILAVGGASERSLLVARGVRGNGVL